MLHDLKRLSLIMRGSKCTTDIRAKPIVGGMSQSAFSQDVKTRKVGRKRIFFITPMETLERKFQSGALWNMVNINVYLSHI